MVTRHAGDESAQLARYWLARQPENVIVFRDSAGQPAGFMTLLAMERATAEDLAVDPAVAAAWDFLQRNAPLRPGESATYFRFWLAADTYQAVSPTQSLIFINMVRHYFTPGLAFTFLRLRRPGFLAADLLLRRSRPAAGTRFCRRWQALWRLWPRLARRAAAAVAGTDGPAGDRTGAGDGQAVGAGRAVACAQPGRSSRPP